ncbi:MAG: hypothetical protein IPL45_04015 [Actinomycetales bacterium]|nr:hypothetical protein [Actinomycetales bacterium]
MTTRLAEIELERSRGGTSGAARQFSATYFEPEARASRPVGGTLETVAAVT